MICCKWAHWSVIRRNKYYLWSLLNQQNRVIDLAPRIANRILSPLGSRAGLLGVLMLLSWFQYSKRVVTCYSPASEHTASSIIMSALQMLKAATEINFWHCCSRLVKWKTEHVGAIWELQQGFVFLRNPILYPFFFFSVKSHAGRLSCLSHV